MLHYAYETQDLHILHKSVKLSCFIHLCNSHSPLILRKSLLYIFCIALICTVAERMCNTFYAIVLSYQNNLLTSTSQGWNIVFSHKFASSVNLDKFTPFCPIPALAVLCKNAWLGFSPIPSFHHTVGGGYAFILNAIFLFPEKKTAATSLSLPCHSQYVSALYHYISTNSPSTYNSNLSGLFTIS